MNVLQIGSQMDEFSYGLQRACGIKDCTLDLTCSRVACGIRSDWETSLRAVVELLRTLRVLDLYANGIEYDDMRIIADGLRACRSLTVLGLEHNRLADEGAEKVASALRENRECQLETLSLTDNNIGVAGSVALAAYLEESSSLRILSLGQNAVGDAGVTALATALMKNTESQLRNLDLHCNGIGPAGGKLLASYAVSSTMLVWLDICGNRSLDEASRRVLRQARKPAGGQAKYIML